MRPGREIDTKIATEIFGHKVWARGKVLFENPQQGDRPLRSYSREIEWAWTVAEKMKISLLPIEGGQWFAFVGPAEVQGWSSPEAMLELLNSKEFSGCGAAVGEDVSFVICQAALRAIEKRKSETPTSLPLDSRPELVLHSPDHHEH